MTFGNLQATEELNEILAKPNIQLEEVLDNDALVPELRNQNTKLICYLCKPQIFE